tara:strand:+ start:342 stop:632 length:291 start_codon:yes stop_codon:yes gene_type:complete
VSVPKVKRSRRNGEKLSVEKQIRGNPHTSFGVLTSVQAIVRLEGFLKGFPEVVWTFLGVLLIENVSPRERLWWNKFRKISFFGKKEVVLSTWFLTR